MRVLKSIKSSNDVSKNHRNKGIIGVCGGVCIKLEERWSPLDFSNQMNIEQQQVELRTDVVVHGLDIS
jgi:hypothetical protein